MLSAEIGIKICFPRVSGVMKPKPLSSFHEVILPLVRTGISQNILISPLNYFADMLVFCPRRLDRESNAITMREICL
jgi:hypothetical protein